MVEWFNRKKARKKTGTDRPQESATIKEKARQYAVDSHDESEGLFLLTPKPSIGKEFNVDIVAAHGLGGHYKET